ncbi:MAG: ParB/RepB/Spo0J family partition protein, partial [Spirochaetales bacterium]|nr:ParB/RepB/Spo0J family partition protein [Spirochaetales bacterium]
MMTAVSAHRHIWSWRAYLSPRSLHMANQKIGVGRLGESLMNENAEGINALLDVNVRAEGSEGSTQSDGTVLAGFVEMNISDIITNPNQPRKEFSEEAINELAQSIKAIGIIQPITVTKNGDKYVIVAGERRFRAAQAAGLEKVPVLIKDLSLRQKLEISLIENIQRENLNAIEEALAYTNLIQQYNLTQEEMAERVGKSRAAIANAMRLLGLDPIIQKMLIDR